MIFIHREMKLVHIDLCSPFMQCFSVQDVSEWIILLAWKM